MFNSCEGKDRHEDASNQKHPKKPGGRWSELLFSLTTRQPISHAIIHIASCSHFTRPLPRSSQKVLPASLEAQCLHVPLVLHLLSVCCPNILYCPVTSAPHRIHFLCDLWHHPLPDLISLYRSEGHSNNGTHRWAKRSNMQHHPTNQLGCGHNYALTCTKGAGQIN